MNPNDYLFELKNALDEYRYLDVRSLTNKIDPSAFDLLQVKKTLGLIRRKRLFTELENTSSLFYMAGKNAPIVRRQWCQSLLDQGKVSQALTTLKAILKEYEKDSIEGPEIRGLIGRAYKQIYVNEGGTENLRSAISAYLPDWELRLGDYRWQGINLVALLSRAEHDNVDPGYAVNSEKIAKLILEDIDEKGTTGVWDYATGMEASIALNDQTQALQWVKKYVQHPDTDAFELASTLRQLKEVWCLEGTTIGNILLPVLEYALLHREGGTVQPMRFENALDRTGFEAVWGAEAYTYIDWIDTLKACCDAIGRVGDAATGKPCGTGFLVKGGSLMEEWEDAPVFLTNSHVVSLNQVDEAPLRPAEAIVEFTRLSGRPKVSLGELLFYSARNELDISIFRINAPASARTLETYPYLPKVGTDPKDPQRTYVIGHPNGSELAVSLYDNSLVEYERQYVRYRSPTEGGHSGSPVLTRQLKTFGIHHRALYDRQLNEGIVLNALKTELEKKMKYK